MAPEHSSAQVVSLTTIPSSRYPKSKRKNGLIVSPSLIGSLTCACVGHLSQAQDLTEDLAHQHVHQHTRSLSLNFLYTPCGLRFFIFPDARAAQRHPSRAA